MSDVTWRMVVVRDPAAAQTLASFERMIIDSQRRVDRTRVSMALQAERTIASARQQQLVKQEQMYLAFLNRQARQYQQFLNNQVKAAQQAQTQMPNFGLPGVGGGSGGPAGRGGGGGLGGAGVAAMAGGLVRRFLPVATVAGAAAFGQQSLGAYSERQMLEMRMGTLAGSKAKGQSLIGGMKKLGLEAGVNVNDLADAANTMAGFEVPIDSINKRLTQLAAITGGDTDRMKRLALAFAQATGQGRLMGEELNQMIDAGFNPLLEISKMTGKSIAELRDEMREGKLSVELLNAALDETTSAGGKFGGMMEAMKGSTTQSLNAMSQAWQEFKISVGRGLGEAKIAGVNVVQKASEESTSFLTKLGGSLEFIFNHSQNAFEGTERQRGRELYQQGYRSTDKVVSNAAAANRYLENKALAAQGMGQHSERYINQTEADQLRAYELEIKQTEQAEKRTALEEKIKNYRKQISDYWDNTERDQIRAAANELTSAKAIAEIRLKAAQAELEKRQDILKTADKALEKAQESMMSARERFGMKSDREQAEALGLLQNARTNGVGSLSLDQLNKLRSIGTVEAEGLAKQGYLNRSSAAFNTGSVSGIQNQQAEVRAQMARLSEKQYSAPVNQRRQRDQLAALHNRELELRSMETAQGMAIDRAMAMRSSVFDGERRQIGEARAQKQFIEANVKSQIDVVLKYEDQIAGLREQILPLLMQAEKKRMEDVTKVLAPLQKQVNALTQRSIALNGGQG